jgi:hypothetical protein
MVVLGALVVQGMSKWCGKINDDNTCLEQATQSRSSTPVPGTGLIPVSSTNSESIRLCKPVRGMFSRWPRYFASLMLGDISSSEIFLSSYGRLA